MNEAAMVFASGRYLGCVDSHVIPQNSMGCDIIDLFHNNFSPSGTQPEHRKLAHEL